MNNLELILEELMAPNKISVYHSSDNPDLNGLMANDDFVPGVFGAGKMHGKGFYSVWKKEDLSEYGEYEYKGIVDLNNTKIFILDPDFYKEIYKKVMPKNYIIEQLEKNNISGENFSFFQKRILSGKFSSSLVLSEIEKTVNLSKYFEGVAYHGDRDGHCLLMWNYRKVKIIGKYDSVFNKTAINTKKFVKQKKGFFKNQAVYSKGKVKIAERNGNYIFFYEGKKIVEISRTQKEEDPKVFEKLKTMQKFCRKYKVPKEVINQLTFTNGKKINNAKTLFKTAEARIHDAATPLPININVDINNGSVIKKVNIITAKNLPTKADFYYLEEIRKYVAKMGKTKIINLMKLTPLKLKAFNYLPKEIEYDKNVIFDVDGERTLLQYNKDKKLMTFKGKFINYSKISFTIELETALKLFGIRNKLNLEPFFKGTEVKIFCGNSTNNLLKKITSFSGCCLTSVDIEDIHTKVLPPMQNILNYSEYPIKLIHYTDIDFGKSFDNWRFNPYTTNEIIYNKKMNPKAIKELKKRNPEIKFKERIEADL